jgi:hypothetical protein
VAADVLADVGELAGESEERGRVEAARAFERVLGGAGGVGGGENGGGVQRSWPTPLGVGRRPQCRVDMLERRLAAHPARRGEMERPLGARIPREPTARPDLDDVRGEIVARPDRRDVSRPADQPLAEKEPDRELLVLARRPHRHGHRLPVDADLERLLHDELVAVLLAARGRHPLDRGSRNMTFDGCRHTYMVPEAGHRYPTGSGALPPGVRFTLADP